jgi:hypothetical protein
MWYKGKKCVLVTLKYSIRNNFYSMSHQVFWLSWQLAKISDEAEKSATFLALKSNSSKREK